MFAVKLYPWVFVLLCAAMSSETFTAQEAGQNPSVPPAATPSTQQPESPQQGKGTMAPNSQSLSTSLGVYVFPAKGQKPEQQNSDEASCYSWAKSQTGIDPMSPEPQSQTISPQSAQQPQQSTKDPSKGSGAKGAAGGAGAGAAIGAVAGDTGKGAAIGATAGAMAGRRKGKKAKKAAEEQQKQQEQKAQADTQAQAESRKGTYNKAFSACMEGKGYTVK